MSKTDIDKIMAKLSSIEAKVTTTNTSLGNLGEKVNSLKLQLTVKNMKK